MSYVTLEVLIEKGMIIPKAPDKLPDSGSGLLTILESTPANPPEMAPLEAFRKLQAELQVTSEKAEIWKRAIREGRR